MIIQHNIAALNSYKNMKSNKNKFSKNLEKLSSGYKINRAGDDAAGLAISESLRMLINGTKQAKSNTQDGIGLIHTAEGAMQEIHSMLQRSYQLSMASANSTYNDQERPCMQEEIDELKAEIDRIAKCTEFNGVKVLQGKMKPDVLKSEVELDSELPDWVMTDESMAKGYLSVPYTTEEECSNGNKYTISHSSAMLDFTKLDDPSSGANISDLDKKGFFTTCFTCDRYYSIRFKSDGTGNSMTENGMNFIFEIDISGINSSSPTPLSEQLVKAIIDGTEHGNPNRHYTKLAADKTNPGKLVVYDDRSSDSLPAGTSYSDDWTGWDNPSFNVNRDTCPDRGNFGSGVMVTIPGKFMPACDIILQIGPTAPEILEIDLPYIDTWDMGLNKVIIATQKKASSSIGTLKNTIDFISNERGRMGAYENRLEHAYNALTSSEENLTAAESRIRDTDMAEEITGFTKNQILLQASQSIMAQANASTQGVLGLMGQ